MAVVHVVPYNVHHPGLYPAHIVLWALHRLGDLVCDLEAQSYLRRAQAVGVLLHAGDGLVAVLFPDQHGDLRGYAEGPKVYHQFPHAVYPLILLAYLLRLFLGYALYLGEPCGVVLDNLQGVGPKGVDNAPGQHPANALHRAGGQISEHSLLCNRAGVLEYLGPKLAAIALVLLPAAVDLQFLTVADHGYGPNHSDLLPVLPGKEHQHGILILFIAVHHVFHLAA